MVLRDSASPTADLTRDACSGGAAGATCRSKHLKPLWGADSDGAAGRTGRRSSTTSEAGHAGGTVIVTTNVSLQITHSSTVCRLFFFRIIDDGFEHLCRLSSLRNIKDWAGESRLVPIMHTIVCESPRQGLAQQTVPEQQNQAVGKNVKHLQFNAHNSTLQMLDVSSLGSREVREHRE